MPITSSADLIALLSSSGLLDQAQLAKVNRALQGRTPDPKTLVKELVKHGWITTYQANLLIQGRAAELVLGSYILLERLGAGGMGQVFKARHQIMNRTVALKVISKERLVDRDAVQRFHQEIRMAAQLNHPHIVQAYEAGQVGETHFLVMEYAEGTDVQRLVQKSGPLAVGQACAYTRQAVLGLQHALERGMVHRDIKPSNLQVTAQGTLLKILDMGLARFQGHDRGAGQGAALTQARTLLGTPDYMAPEQIADPRGVDIRADIYSLGCTFYFMLAGRPPFPDGAWEEKLVSHRKVEPVPIEQVRRDVPPAVGAILRKMMAKRPEDRYSAPAAIADALAPFCALAASVSLPAPNPIHQTPGSPPGSPNSLVDRPASGYEAGWSLNVDSTLGSQPAPPTQSQPTTPFSSPTVLAPGQHPAQPTQVQPLTASPPQQPGAWKRHLLILTGAGAILGLLILVLILFGTKGGDNQPPADPRPAPPPADAPRILIDEDFRTSYKNKLAVPEGWDGDAFRVIKEDDLCGLEVSKPTGLHFVQLPPLKLSGNFSIEGVYRMGHPAFANYHALTISLENRTKGTLLPIVFDWQGKVLIGNDPRLPPPSYKPLKPTHFLVKREGKKLRVFLDKEPVADQNLDEVAEFDKVRLGLNGGPGNDQRLARIYGLKIVVLP